VFQEKRHFSQKNQHKSPKKAFIIDIDPSCFGDVILTPQRTRVARWFIFEPKIPIWVNFGLP
jgi:hypothetical protein